MSNKVTTISYLIPSVASSCLSHRLPGVHGLANGDADEIEDEDDEVLDISKEEKEEEEEEQGLRIWEEENPKASRNAATARTSAFQKVSEMESFMHEVFEAVASVKRAYMSLQEAHSPWDPDKMRVADVAVVAELRKLGRLRDRFRRGHVHSTGAATTAAPLREAVMPYEAALEDLKRELKAKEAELDSLKEKLRIASELGGSGRRGHRHTSKRVGCITVLGAPGMPTQELFETYRDLVKSTAKSFTAHLLSLMRSARWDTAAAVRSIIDGGGSSDNAAHTIATTMIPILDPCHAKHALVSYVNRKFFQGFENETFYIEGSLSSLLHPAEFRRDCFARFRDMRGIEPSELLGILPKCAFGQFAAKKYVAIVHAKMEESLFGSVEQRWQVLAGGHPRTGFYREFLELAKAVWLLHLLAFALDPPPRHFEATKGAEFHAKYMESVVRFSGGRVPPGLVVGFSVGPGFKLANGAVLRASVYLVPKLQAS